MDPTETEGSAQGGGVKRLVAVGLVVGVLAVAGLAARAAQSPAPEPPAPLNAAQQAPVLAALAATPAAPKGIPDEATIARYMAIGQARYGATFMTPAETRDADARRLATYYLMVDEELDRRRAAAGGGRRGAAIKMSFVEVRAFLGEAAYADQEALAAKVKGGRPN